LENILEGLKCMKSSFIIFLTDKSFVQKYLGASKENDLEIS
jgi:hypothetical protein